MALLDLQAMETPAQETRWDGGANSATSLLLCLSTNSETSLLLCF